MDLNEIDLIGKQQPGSERGKVSDARKDGGWMAKLRAWVRGKSSVKSATKIVAMRSLTVGPRSDQPGFDVNLIPEMESKKNARTQFRVLGSAVCITIGLLLIVEVLLLLQRSKALGNVSEVEGQLQMVEKAIVALEPVQREASALQERVMSANAVLDQHVQWIPLLTKIEALTLPSVTYSSFVADQNGSLTMSASASSFDDVGAQLNVLSGADGIVDVEISGVTGKSSGESDAENTEPLSSATAVDFSISLKFDPNLLRVAPFAPLTSSPSSDARE